MQGDVVVITGAFGQLGTAVRGLAAERGARLALIDHAHHCPEGPEALVLGGVDLTDYAQAQRAMDAVRAQFGELHVLLNIAGVVSGKSLGEHRPWIVIGTFIFAAVATPSADPFTMTFMAVPMVVLFGISEVIARFNDRRRAARKPYGGLSPDQLSPL